MIKTKKFWYILLFGILYLIVAFSSFFHACAFFGLANNDWMSIILAFAFEVGQAAVLFSLLTSTKDRSRIMPWVLMTMFTLVQVIGNVYSSYKYIITNSVENLRYFKEPIFIWTDLPDAQANVIIVYLVGALLPVAALLLTSMITNYLSDNSEEVELKKNSNIGISEETKDKLNNMLNDALDNTSEKELNEILDEKEQDDKKDDESDNDEVISEQGEDDSKVLVTDKFEDIENHVKDEQKQLEELENNNLKSNSEIIEEEIEPKDKLVEDAKTTKPSHFINL